jgi:hypothetical protein
LLSPTRRAMTRQAFFLIRRYGVRAIRQASLAARAAPRFRYPPHQPRRDLRVVQPSWPC